MRKVAPHVPAHSIQYLESRRVWVAAQRRLFVYFSEELVLLSDEKAEAELKRLDTDMKEYWKLACEDKD